MLDLFLIAFLGYLSYCLYIVIIVPYQKARLHDKEQLLDFLKNFSDSSPDTKRPL